MIKDRRVNDEHHARHLDFEMPYKCRGVNNMVNGWIHCHETHEPHLLVVGQFPEQQIICLLPLHRIVHQLTAHPRLTKSCPGICIR